MLRSIRLRHSPRPSPRPQQRRPLFGLSFPTPSNEPLAGTLDGSGPPWLFLAQVIFGLPTALWTYKVRSAFPRPPRARADPAWQCLLMVLFQRRLIYLPSVPPGSRNEKLEERKDQLGGMRCEQVEVRSRAPSRWLRRDVVLKGVQLSWTDAEEKAGAKLAGAQPGAKPDVVVVYLQGPSSHPTLRLLLRNRRAGNAGTPLHRIPLFSRLLSPARSSTRTRITLVASAPRSFWLSSRSTPTQTTLLADYTSIVTHTRLRFPTTPIVLYGHSLGGAIAILHAVQHPSTPIAGIILENPLPSIPYMVRALYPQKWLPYHYLGPLVFDRWNAVGALENHTGRLPRSLWIRSGDDEIIPADVEGGEGGVRRMYGRWTGEKRWVDVRGALHDTAFLRVGWKDEVRGFLDGIVREDRETSAQ